MKNVKDKVVEGMANFAKNMVQPLLYVAVIGMILLLGIILTNSRITEALPFLGWGPLPFIGKLIYNCLMFIINNLSIVLCVGIAGAMAKKYRHHACIIALISFFIFLNANNLTLTQTGNLAEMGMLGLIGTGQASVFGIQVLDMGVFGGIIMGVVTGAIFNKFCDAKFNGYWQMFSGVRFPFVIMIAVSIFLGWGATYVWPFVQMVISSLTNFMSDSGYIGLFLYGFLNKFLVPAGLHHLVYAPFQFSEMGGVATIAGEVYTGAMAIRTAEVAAELPFSDATYWMVFTFNNLFPYLGIAAAFYTTAKPKNKEKTKAMLIPLTVTVLLSSLTEPFDFLFCFSQPLLFLVLSIISGISVVLLKVFSLPAATSGGIINVIISNIVAGYERTKWPFMILLGLVVAVVTYVIFVFLIKKFDYKTPGREDDEEEEGTTIAKTDAEKIEEKPEEKGTETDAGDELSQAKAIIAGLGGSENIVSVDCCFTRLRVELKDVSAIDEKALKKTGCSGVVKKSNEVQVVYGMQVGEIKNAVESAL